MDNDTVRRVTAANNVDVWRVLKRVQSQNGVLTFANSVTLEKQESRYASSYLSPGKP